jgi:hypothetical protein
MKKTVRAKEEWCWSDRIKEKQAVVLSEGERA